MSASPRPPMWKRASARCGRSLVARVPTASSARLPTSICATSAGSAATSNVAGSTCPEGERMDQDQSSQERNGHDADDAFGQAQPITDKPGSAQSKGSTNGAGAARFLQPASQQDNQGETAPRSIPVKSMLGTSNRAGDASLSAVAMWPGGPDDRTASAYPTNQQGALPTPPALRQSAAPLADDAGRLSWEAADSWGD